MLYGNFISKYLKICQTAFWKWLLYFTFPTNSIWECWFFHILAKTCYYLSCWLQAILVGIKQYFNMVSIYISLEKAMAPHFSTLAWKIPWAEEPGRLQSMGSLGVGHAWATSLSLFTFMHWRRKWQPTPVFLPGESQGRGSLVGCCLWGHTELDTTEVT